MNIIKYINQNWNYPLSITKEYKKYDFSKESELVKGSLHHLGILGFKKDLNKAENYYKDYYNKNYENIYIINNLGLLYYEKGEYRESYGYYKQLPINSLNKLNINISSINIINLYYNNFKVSNNLLLEACYQTILSSSSYDRAAKDILLSNYTKIEIMNKMISYKTDLNIAENDLECSQEYINELEDENKKLKAEIEEYSLHEAYKPDSIIARKLKEEFEKNFLRKDCDKK